MSNHRYLELNSQYRDRVRWPLPGQFEVPISQSGTKSRNDAIDPVSLAAPITSWTSNEFDTTGGGASITGVIVAGPGLPPAVGAAGSQQTIIVEFSGVEDPQTISNYYVNAMLVAGENAVTLTPIQQRRIISSKFISVVGAVITMQFIVDSPFSDVVVDGIGIDIHDPTDLSDVNNPQVFIPVGRVGENAYAGCLLYNETSNHSRPVSGYNAITHLLTVDTTQATVANVTQGPVTGWAVTDNYSIRKERPVFTGTSLAGSTITSVIFNAASSIVDDFYNNYFLRMTSGVADDEVTRITDYVGSTQTATVFPPFSVAPGAADTLEIMAFSYDNAVPFDYSGSMVSQQEEVCYEIDLLNLVLPNRTLNTSSGSTIAFYPYVYVNLCNVTAAGAGNVHVLYSNNPNASRMLFRAAIDDVPNLLTSSFIKIDGDGAVQTVKFKINDNLLFEVRLPDGSIFKTTLDETFSPFPPNVDNQISALFSLKRL